MNLAIDPAVPAAAPAPACASVLRSPGPRPRRLAALAAALASLALAAPLPARAAAYQIDPGHTQIHWEVVHMGTSTLRARFDKIEGSILFDAAARTIDLGIKVDPASVSSGSPGFDKVLRGSQLFAVQEHPVVWYVAKRATFEGDVPRQVHGEITLRGVNQALTLTATRWRCGLNPLFGREVCGGDFEAQLKRSDFGMTLALPLVSDTITLRIAVEAVVVPTP